MAARSTGVVREKADKNQRGVDLGGLPALHVSLLIMKSLLRENKGKN